MTLTELTGYARAIGLTHPRSARPLVKSEIHRLLHNPISMGEFDWKGRRYPGTHDPLISRELWERTQEAFADANRPRYIKHRFAYTGLLTCGACGCAITAERRKGRYVYYHCTGYRGSCKSGYVREELLTGLLADVVGKIQLTPEQADWIAKALRESQADKEREHQRALLLQQQQYQRVQQMLDRAYEDRLAGTISEDLWLRRSREWELELSRLRSDLERRETASARYMLLGSQILELARDAKSLFLRQDPAEQRRLLKTLLSNCTLKAGTLCPTYRKPFDALVDGNETGNWLGGRDSCPFSMQPSEPKASDGASTELGLSPPPVEAAGLSSASAYAAFAGVHRASIATLGACRARPTSGVREADGRAADSSSRCRRWLDRNVGDSDAQTRPVRQDESAGDHPVDTSTSVSSGRAR